MSRDTILQQRRQVKFGLFVIQAPSGEELVARPLCNGCGKVILDPDSANLVFADDFNDLTQLGEVDGLPVSQMSGGAGAYHFECDPGGKPWMRLSDVIPNDPRKCSSVIEQGTLPAAGGEE